MAADVTVYISIGNSDDKLPQVRWAEFAEKVLERVALAETVKHGVWWSEPLSNYQNMCVGFDITLERLACLRYDLRGLAAEFQQDSIALAVVHHSEMIGPRP